MLFFFFGSSLSLSQVLAIEMNPPLFAPPPSFQRVVVSGRACAQAHAGSGLADKKLKLQEELQSWAERSDYTSEKVAKLIELELSLPEERLTYLELVQAKHFVSVRVFNGAEGTQSALPMERKYPELVLPQNKNRFELGLLTASVEVTQVVDPVSKMLADYFFDQSFHDPTLLQADLWVSARKAQARLYENIGFRATGQKTEDGLELLHSSVADFIEHNKNQVKTSPMTRAELERKRQEERAFSNSLRQHYLEFWRHEERVRMGEADSFPFMQPMPEDHALWLISKRNSSGHSRMLAEQRRDGLRWERIQAARMVHEGRQQLGLTSSRSLVRVAYYYAEFRPEHRFNRVYSSTTVPVSFGSGHFVIRTSVSASNYIGDASMMSPEFAMFEAAWERERLGH
jgi:hypothetical protein